MNDKKVRLVLAGVGLVGKRHVDAINRSKDAELIAIVDPNEEVKTYATENAVPWYPNLTELFSNEKPDGVILATPNKFHVENGLECVKAKCPMLVEKPIAVTSKEALNLVNSAQDANIPVLVGHHRRHNPLIKKAKEIIESGRLGQVRALQATCWFFKPDDYFDIAPWRKVAGAGPVSVNLVHDVDLIRYLCGDVVSVQAQMVKSIRGFENEDVAGVLLRFKNGAIGTITVSDMIVAPWSWEFTAQENPAYPPLQESCYQIGGTHGSLSVPDLSLWENKEYDGKRGWWQPMSATTFPREWSEPLINQVDQFAAVIRGEEEPLVSGEEGFKTLQVIEAIQNSAETGETIKL